MAKRTIDNLGEQNTDFERRIKYLEGQEQLQRLLSDVDGTAYLTPGSEGYTVVHFDLGYMTVSLEDVQPYANGSRITLRFGNPTSAQIDGISANLEWGKVNAKGYPDETTQKSRTIDPVQTLNPASWTRVPVVLEGVPPSAFGFLRVKNVQHKGIKLYGH